VTAVLTAKQREANRLLAGPARNVMLRGGSRSGKTFLMVRALIQRAINAPGSRHVIFRFRFNHAKTSVWSDTLPKVLKLCFPGLRVRFDKTDFFVELTNGSQIWIGGLDDKERVEKILGQEYATLYFNESSQIPWGSVETAMSRLAQKVALAPEIAAATRREFLSLKAYFDCNPPSKLHWSYQLFRAGLKPGTKEKLPKPEDYAEMRVNPADNAENLPAEYFDVLAGMSSAKRLRFEAGEWASEVSGALWAVEDRQAPDGKLMPGLDSLRVAEAPEMRRIVVSVERFADTLEQGLKIFEDVVAGLGDAVLPGEAVFRLYDTYGFPADLTADLARERGLGVQRSGDGGSGSRAQNAMVAQILTEMDGFRPEVQKGVTDFTGYDDIVDEGTVIALYRDGEECDRLGAGERAVLVLDVTPFYAESGGQVGDRGQLLSDAARFDVEDTQKQGDGIICHIGRVTDGDLLAGTSSKRLSLLATLPKAALMASWIR